VPVIFYLSVRRDNFRKAMEAQTKDRPRHQAYVEPFKGRRQTVTYLDFDHGRAGVDGNDSAAA